MTKVEKMKRCDRPMVLVDLGGLIDSLKSAPEKQAKDAACLLVDAIVYGTSKDMETVRQAIKAGESAERASMILWRSEHGMGELEGSASLLDVIRKQSEVSNVA